MGYQLTSALSGSLDASSDPHTHPQPSKHPSQDYCVYVTLDPCHMLKLARNALGSLSTFIDQNGGKTKWEFFKNLHALQQQEGLKLSNRLTTQHREFKNIR